ncbi:MAG: type II toxin-antitoxin system RelE/ParE family toxin [bacterium]
MANYSIEIKKSAAKEIQNLPSTEIKTILSKIEQLSENPRPYNSLKLSDEEKYRIRVGRYRILYHISDEQLLVTVVKVAHRKDVYK